MCSPPPPYPARADVGLHVELVSETDMRATRPSGRPDVGPRRCSLQLLASSCLIQFRHTVWLVPYGPVGGCQSVWERTRELFNCMQRIVVCAFFFQYLFHLLFLSLSYVVYIYILKVGLGGRAGLVLKRPQGHWDVKLILGWAAGWMGLGRGGLGGGRASEKTDRINTDTSTVHKHPDKQTNKQTT